MSSYTGINWSGGTGFGLGLECESGWTLGLYSENSEKIDFEDFPDQRVEGQNNYWISLALKKLRITQSGTGIGYAGVDIFNSL